MKWTIYFVKNGDLNEAFYEGSFSVFHGETVETTVSLKEVIHLSREFKELPPDGSVKCVNQVNTF